MGKRTSAICFIGFVLMGGVVDAVPIVNNLGESSEDSLTFNILNLLPSGNPADRLDSAYFTVFKSHTDNVIFRDSSSGVNMIGVDSFVIGGDVVYYFHRAVADIDGSGAPGTYGYNFMAVYNDSNMRTPTIGQFQITGWELDDIGDSVGLAADNSGKSLDSLHLVIDSLMAVLDTLQNHDDWVSAYDAGSDIVVAADTTSSGQGLLTYSGGVDSTLLLKRFAISGANGSSASFYVRNLSDNSSAVFFDADGNGAATAGIRIDGNVGFGMYVTGGTRDIGLEGSGHIHGAIDSLRHISVEAADTIANRVLEDSSSYNKGIDSFMVARYVWNTPQDNHTLTGSFGKYLDTEISGLGSGSGLYSVRLVTVDSAANQAIPGVNMSIRNIDQSALIASGKSDMQGYAEFNLDADSFLVVSFSPGYIFDSFDTVVVAGEETDSICGYQFNPGSPSDPDLCRVYGYLYDIEGNPESGANIAAWLPTGVSRFGTTIVSPFKVETESDEDGYFYLDLIRNSGLIPDTCRYEIAISLNDGTILRERVLVPDLSTWQLTW